jgi:glycine/D-amino acid oxidase-like deaminating enzyme
MTEAAKVSLWDGTADEPDHEAPLPGDATPDVAIVGGGYTGLSTALHAAERGLDCLVLEAQRIGHGGSGRNAGLVNAGVWHPPAAVRTALGSTYGPRFIERFGSAPEYVFGLIERHQIRCEPARNGTIHAAHAPSGLKGLQGRHDEWKRLGAPVEMLSAGEVAERTGTHALRGRPPRPAGGHGEPDGLRPRPRAGRARRGRADRHGRARDGPPARRRRWVVETDRGTVRARAVVLGTNAYTDDLWPGLRQGFTLIDYFQFATEPLGAAGAGILPGRHGLWDTAPVMTSLRKDLAGRLVVGSMGRVMGDATSGLSRRWAEKRLRQLFPDLGPVAFEEAWHGQIALTPDHLPRIHRLAENLWTPIGYNGRGITTGTVFGKAMADLLSGMDPAELPLPVSAPRAVAATGLRARLYRLAFAANQAVKGL